MRIFLKSALAIIVLFVLVIFIEKKLCFIYGFEPPDPLNTIFRVYFPK